jgi:hypothetical protein
MVRFETRYIIGAAQLGKKSTDFEEHITTDKLSDYTGDLHKLRPLRCKNESNQI